GLGTIDELWVNVPAAREPSAAAALSRPPFTQLSVQSRAATLTGLQADPLARGSLLTLAGTAAVALLLALVGLLLAVAGDVRDDRGDLFDLEAQGASRSEEHTSELQSPDHLVCRLLLAKKKQRRTDHVGGPSLLAQ